MGNQRKKADFYDQRDVLLEGINRPDVSTNTILLVGALVLIADELHEANEQNKGVGVFRECLLTTLQGVGK